MSMEHFDTLIVGAGLSGIGSAVHLQQRCAGQRFAILEGRERLGGTWDLFRYPGVRSDSDMYTLGYAFKPWTSGQAIADGPSILQYIQDTAQEHGLLPHIRLGHRVVEAAWSSGEGRWLLTVERGPAKERLQLSCNFLWVCSGYYNYAHGYTPDFPGMAQFKGRVVHPQHWPADLDYRGQRVVVIGSGATAMTLVPAMAQEAAQVTMLQRSPTYVVARPRSDALANALRRILPARLAYGLTRWKNVGLGLFFFGLAKRKPDRVKARILDAVAAALPKAFDVQTHFTPRYKPWDQRVCLVPDGDLFKSIRGGKVHVVTDTVQTFEPEGIRLGSGAILEADVVVTATGLDLLGFGGMALSVDGKPVEIGKTMSYKGMMLAGVPNLAYVIGYTNASWTLKSDLTGAFVCRVLRHMHRSGAVICIPKMPSSDVQQQPWVDFSSGYIQRSLEQFPVQGSSTPWRLNQNYLRDLLDLRFGALQDGVLQFSKLQK
jgi:cation diffusion facilitator CzcD-associated flavoprotein CzcO